MDISYGNSLEPNACNKSSVIGWIVTNILQFDWTTIRNQIWSIDHQFISYEVRILNVIFFFMIFLFLSALNSAMTLWLFAIWWCCLRWFFFDCWIFFLLSIGLCDASGVFLEINLIEYWGYFLALCPGLWF